MRAAAGLEVGGRAAAGWEAAGWEAVGLAVAGWEAGGRVAKGWEAEGWEAVGLGAADWEVAAEGGGAKVPAASAETCARGKGGQEGRLGIIMASVEQSPDRMLTGPSRAWLADSRLL